MNSIQTPEQYYRFMWILYDFDSINNDDKFKEIIEDVIFFLAKFKSIMVLNLVILCKGESNETFINDLYILLCLYSKCHSFKSHQSLLSGVSDYFDRNKISSGGDLSHYSSASLY